MVNLDSPPYLSRILFHYHPVNCEKSTFPTTNRMGGGGFSKGGRGGHGHDQREGGCGRGKISLCLRKSGE